MNQTTRKHFISVTALFMMLCMVCTMFASCFLFPTTITLDKTEAALFVGDSIKLVATVSNEDADVEWSTSNEKVVTVRRGTVTAVGVGTAVITAQVEGGASATCNITVSERTISISKTEATINLDESNTLELTATASDNGEITWTSSDPALATVANGVVTAYDIGSVTITAQRGAATATCQITIVEPSRPADYYHITKLTNAEVVADPGVWHYHADGSMGGDYGFESTPLHKNSTASVTLNVIPKVANSQYFYFRYQPDQVELNSYYKMSVTITVSEDATLRIGSRRADGSTFAPLNEEFKAGEPKTVEYIGYRNEYEPFSVRINSEIDAEKVTLTVQLNSVEAHDGKDLPEYHTKVEEKPKVNYEQLPTDDSAYDLELKTNGETMSSPDKWHFNQGESSIVSSVKYNNGTITFDFETLQMTGNSQLRFRPTLDPNTKIKVEFTVTSNVAAKVVLALCDSVTFASTDWNEKRLDGTNSQTFVAEMTIKESQLIFIQVQALDEVKSNASFIFSDIKIYKEVAGQPGGDQPGGDQPGGNDPQLPTIENGYYLESGNKATVLANPGKWYYFGDGAEGTDYVLASAPKIDNGVITYAFSSMTAGANYMLRYQPTLAAGTNYTISVTVEVDGACKILYSKDYKVHIFEEAGSVTLTWNGEVDASNPYMIQIKECTAPITLTVKDITITEGQAGGDQPGGDQPGGDQPGGNDPQLPTIENGYYLESGNKATVLANPGKWYYFGDGAEGTDYVLASAPKIDNGVITYAFSSMTAGANYMLRYQPTLAAGTNYTISVTVEVDGACKILYSKDYKVHIFEEAGNVTLTWNGEVDASNPYMIQIKECTAPITLKVSAITIEAHEHNYNQESTQVATSATCTANQVNYYACSCGAVGTTTYEVAETALGHKYTTYTSNNDATCKADGTKTAKCDHGCGASDTKADDGSKLAHKYTTYTSNNDATCNADGTKTAKCDYNCGESDTKADEGSKLAHKYTTYASNNDATCKADGTKTAKCDHGCGASDTKADDGSKLAHKYTTYTSNNDATCVADGTKTAKCDYNCGESDTKADEGTAGHGELVSIAITTKPAKTAYKEGEKFDTTDMVVKATCNKAGCPGYEVTDYTVDKTEALTAADEVVTISYNGKTATVAIVVEEVHVHVYDQESAKVATPATCTTNKLNYHACSCGEVGTTTYEVADSALGHSYTNYASNNDAKCEIDGTKTANCDNGCGKSETIADEGSALDHSYTNYASNNDAKCEIDGTKTASCDNGCGKTDVIADEGSALDHSYTNYVSNNDAKCEIDGTKTAKCDHGCGASDTKADEGSALDHKYTTYTSNNNATCVADGTKTASCDNGCGKTDTVKDEGTAGHGNLASIAISTQPTKTAYKVGEKFDAAGMVVTATCDKAGCPGYEVTGYTVDKIEALAKADTTVTVRYEGKSTTVAITVEEEKPKVSYELTSSNNAGVIANPGKWFYSFDGADGNEYDIVSAPKYEDGTIVVEFIRQATGSPTYQLRYQPDLAVGTEYTFTFTITVSAAGRLGYGPDNKAEDIAAGETKTINWTGAVGSSPFYIQVRATDRSAPITITVSNILINGKSIDNPTNPEEPEEEPKVSYELTSSNNSGVVANPGKWFYSFDGADGNEYDIVSAPKYEDGTIVVEFIRQATGSPTYQLRYQPDLAVGTEYTFTFTITVSAAGRLGYGPDNKAEDIAAGETKTINWTGAVGSSPFYIQVRATDRSAPITITVSNIVITAK